MKPLLPIYLILKVEIEKKNQYITKQKDEKNNRTQFLKQSKIKR
jgi:hypothetical protein